MPEPRLGWLLALQQGFIHTDGSAGVRAADPVGKPVTSARVWIVCRVSFVGWAARPVTPWDAPRGSVNTAHRCPPALEALPAQYLCAVRPRQAQILGGCPAREVVTWTDLRRVVCPAARRLARGGGGSLVPPIQRAAAVRCSFPCFVRCPRPEAGWLGVQMLLLLPLSRWPPLAPSPLSRPSPLSGGLSTPWSWIGAVLRIEGVGCHSDRWQREALAAASVSAHARGTEAATGVFWP